MTELEGHAEKIRREAAANALENEALMMDDAAITKDAQGDHRAARILRGGAAIHRENAAEMREHGRVSAWGKLDNSGNPF